MFSIAAVQEPAREVRQLPIAAKLVVVSRNKVDRMWAKLQMRVFWDFGSFFARLLPDGWIAATKIPEGIYPAAVEGLRGD